MRACVCVWLLWRWACLELNGGSWVRRARHAAPSYAPAPDSLAQKTPPFVGRTGRRHCGTLRAGTRAASGNIAQGGAPDGGLYAVHPHPLWACLASKRSTYWFAALHFVVAQLYPSVGASLLSPGHDPYRCVQVLLSQHLRPGSFRAYSSAVQSPARGPGKARHGGGKGFFEWLSPKRTRPFGLRGNRPRFFLRLLHIHLLLLVLQSPFFLHANLSPTVPAAAARVARAGRVARAWRYGWLADLGPARQEEDSRLLHQRHVPGRLPSRHCSFLQTALGGGGGGR